jgi:hypothetical protein
MGRLTTNNTPPRGARHWSVSSQSHSHSALAISNLLVPTARFLPIYPLTTSRIRPLPLLPRLATPLGNGHRLSILHHLRRLQQRRLHVDEAHGQNDTSQRRRDPRKLGCDRFRYVVSLVRLTTCKPSRKYGTDIHSFKPPSTSCQQRRTATDT